MKININDPFQESEILDGLEAMQRRNDPSYAEAYNWYMQTYQPPVESDYYEGYQGQPQKPTFTEYQPNLAPTPGKFSIDPPLGIGGGFLRTLADKVFPPTMDEVQQRPYRVEDIGGGKTLGGATLQDAILGLTNTLTTGTGSEFLNPVINPYGTGLPQQTPIAETPFVPGEVALSDVEAFGDDFNYPP